MRKDSMKDPSNIGFSDLEREYILVKSSLYKKMFITIALMTLFIILMETLRAIYYAQIGIVMVLMVFVIFGFLFVKFIWNLKKNQEIIITIFCFFYYSSALIVDYYGDSGYFDNPLDSFYLSYAFALCERLIVDRIPKLSYRTSFSISLLLLRLITIPGNDKGVVILQFMYLISSIYLDTDKEKHSRELFVSYSKNKEQLNQFKDLLVQDIPEGIMIITQDLTSCLFVNNSIRALLGYNSKMDVQNQLKEFTIHENSSKGIGSKEEIPTRTSLQQSLLEFLENNRLQWNRMRFNEKLSCNLKYTTPNDSPIEIANQDFVFEAKIMRIVWDEKSALAIVLHDITQQNTILNIKIAADRNKDKMLATVSHELRTPLNGMLGMIQIMQKQAHDKDLLHYLEICKNSGNLLLGLVNSILDLNQIRANKFKLYPEKVHLRELLKDIVRLFELQCTQKGIYLKLEVNKEVPKYLITDKNRLSQIFINLVGNALKFTSKGGISINVEDSSNRDYIDIKIQDTGIGIRDQDQKRLFRMFGKLEDESVKMNRQGVGLGLTISDNLARLLCNNRMIEGIKVDSKYGIGSCFAFTIRKNINYLSTQKDESCYDVSFSVISRLGEIAEKIETYSNFPRMKSKGFSNNLEPLLTQLNTSSGRFMPKINIIEKRKNSGNLIPSKNCDTPRAFSSYRPKESQAYILVVDDNPFNITVAEKLILYNGYRVKSAMSGEEAIELVMHNPHSREPIQLILMDCQMPIMDGYETTKTLKKMMSDNMVPDIPIVALTANNSEEDKKLCKEAGMSDHLCKPLRETELIRILKTYDKLSDTLA